MTALDRYVRLEASGIWQEGHAARPREVVVSFGNATLILRDFDENPVGHWALAGMRVIAEHDGTTVYSTTEDGAETLTIRDRDMAEAIAAVARRDLPNGPRAPSRRRVPVVGPLILAAGVAAAAWWGPDLIRRQAVRMVPPEQAEEFGDQMLLTLMAGGSRLCERTAGQLALGRLATAVAEGPPPRVRVLDLGTAQAAALPGRTVLLNRATLSDAAAPEEVAGWIALALARSPDATLMAAAGLPSAARYLVTGDLGPAALERATSVAVRAPDADEATAALARLAAAGIATRDFAEALRRAGLLAGPGPSVAGEAARPPLLEAQDWAALKAICR